MSGSSRIRDRHSESPDRPKVFNPPEDSNDAVKHSGETDAYSAELAAGIEKLQALYLTTVRYGIRQLLHLSHTAEFTSTAIELDAFDWLDASIAECRVEQALLRICEHFWAPHWTASTASLSAYPPLELQSLMTHEISSNLTRESTRSILFARHAGMFEANRRQQVVHREPVHSYTLPPLFQQARPEPFRASTAAQPATECTQQ